MNLYLNKKDHPDKLILIFYDTDQKREKQLYFTLIKPWY